MEDNSQYHHYIPRFILRNFVQEETNKTKEAEKYYNTKRSKDGLIRYYDLEDGQLGFRKLSRAYGVEDMYRDISLSDANHIEKLLSKLEGRAAKVIHKIRRAQEQRQGSITLWRGDLQTLRRFFFVMEYRSKSRRKKFTSSLDEFIHPDKATISEYIKKRGFRSPSEVWLESLRMILEAEDSADGVGYDLLKGKMYDGDYDLFRYALDYFHVCLCEPEDPADEFIITDNGFSISEGHYILNNPWDHSTYKSYADYHRVATISPRLAIVLRSNIFREGQEFLKEALYRKRAPSSLEDLPVDGAVVNYVNLKMPDGSIRMVNSIEDIEFSMMDSYSMQIYKIPTKHVHIVNMTQIEEAKFGLTFCSSGSMARSLRYHLEKSNPPPIAFITDTRYSQQLHLWSARVRLLTMLDGSLETSGKKPLSLLNTRKITKNVMAEVKDTNYIKLTKGSVDMFSHDIVQATLIDYMRGTIIIGQTRKMEKRDAAFVFRIFTQFLCEFISTRIILLYLRLPHTEENKTAVGWLAPTEAENCVFRLWGDSNVPVTEFNMLLYEAVSKEDVRNKAMAGLLKKHANSMDDFVTAMCEVECYLMRQYGGIRELLYRAGLYTYIEETRLEISEEVEGFEFQDTDEFTYREWTQIFLYTDSVLDETMKEMPELYLCQPIWEELLTIHLYPLLIDFGYIWSLTLNPEYAPGNNGKDVSVVKTSKTKKKKKNTKKNKKR
ncbi:hypothetical protein BJ508DRAFT_410762 [Ascobolus immersus RN42]|uniref:DUF4238 domain-containing protein n=1 Tax=Ascobolus immersus RN42 TaxID=1160509 RepID=A0A3N4ISN2_ASCIM|nr:hypothetical protein BJ508DRAFT_410762 [Ascobolus immersus RN42]